MTPPEAWLWVMIALLGVVLSALFSGMETGVYGLNAVRLHILVRRGHASRRGKQARLLANEIEHQDRLLVTLLIGNNVANYLGAVGVSAALAAWGVGEWEIVVVNAAILTPLLFVFGETIPKDWFRGSADRVMPRLATTLIALRWMFTITLALPVVRIFAAVVERAFRGADSGAVTTARARLVALLKEGRRSGALSESQAVLVDRAIQLRERRIAEEMTPWSAVTSIGADWPRERIARTIRQSHHGHYPVLGSRDEVIGALRALDFWLNQAAPIRTVIRPIARLDAELSVVDAVRTLRGAGDRFSLVERRGRVVGYITERDLLEPLLGKINPS